jgi:hypothetical protein
MAFKMKGWAPKGPLTYKGGGKATNMPKANTVFRKEDANMEADNRGFYENLNDDVNITGMKVGEGQQTVSLDYDDIHSLKVALQRGGLDEETKNAYAAAIERGPGNPMVVDPRSGELNFQTGTGAIITQPGSSDAMNNLLTTLDKSRGRSKSREEAINTPTRLETVKPSRIKTKYDSKEFVPNFKKPVTPRENISTDMPDITLRPSDRNIEGNKGSRTLSQKRAAAVDKKKLSSYGKAWESNKGGVQSKYKNKAEFVKAAEDWWKKKGLDK